MTVKNVTGTGQTGTIQYTSPRNTTYMGGTITGCHLADLAATGKEFLLVLLIHVRENQAVGVISTTDGADGYLPEEDILWSKLFMGNDADMQSEIFTEKVKARRKIREGDVLRLEMRASGSATNHEVAFFHTFFMGY